MIRTTPISDATAMHSNFAPQSDVTGQVNMSRPIEVCEAVVAILERHHTGIDRAYLRRAYHDITAAFWGRHRGLLSCDTPYHDLRHSLATSLLMARMVDGLALLADPEEPELDGPGAMLAVLLALFHDIGFLRRSHEAHLRGAILIHEHERRSIEFVRAYLAQGPLARHVDDAELIWATDVTCDLDRLLANRSPEQRLIGRLLGTADLISQVSSRYYLERCHRYLYREFVSAGADRRIGPEGETILLYASADDLLRKTPAFLEQVVDPRVAALGNLLQCLEAHFEGDDPYARGMARNRAFLTYLIEKGKFDELKRQPMPLPAFSIVGVSGSRETALAA